MSLFLNNNHLQGNVNSSIKLGLYDGEELVSVMTFNKGRVIMGGKKDEYELIRFANKIGDSGVGGASKLLKYFWIALSAGSRWCLQISGTT